MEALQDSFGRRIRNCRISVTDRCNLRCVYCMPTHPDWIPRREILTFEEIVRFARLCLSAGIDHFRLTGGEPTARKDLSLLVKGLSALPGVRDLAMTTNGLLLEKLAGPLRKAGLQRLNVSLDTLSGERFLHLARREGLERVLAGLEAADRAGFRPIKVNMVVIRGMNDDEIVDFAAMSRRKPWQVRFIEFMPLDGDRQWSREKVVPAQEILERIRSVYPLEGPAGPASDPARTFRFRDGAGDVGVIASVTEPFCASCDRIRITADGKLRNCLFAREETDLRALLRGGADDATIVRVLVATVQAKKPGHGIDDPSFLQPVRSMNSIGG